MRMLYENVDKNLQHASARVKSTDPPAGFGSSDPPVNAGFGSSDSPVAGGFGSSDSPVNAGFGSSDSPVNGGFVSPDPIASGLGVEDNMKGGDNLGTKPPEIISGGDEL